MPARLLDGKDLAKRIRLRLTEEVKAFAAMAGIPPGLTVVRVGDDPASAVYVRNKENAARETGFISQQVFLEAGITEAELLDRVHHLSRDPAIHGLLVQLPLPRHIDPIQVQAAVAPEKDVDGFHPVNAGKLLLGQQDALVSCTPRGVMALLDDFGFEMKGAHAVVVGRSNIVGKPLSLLLLARHATVTICHSRTQDLAGICRQADLLIAATGQPGLIGGGHIKPGAVVVDVGINEITDPAQGERLLSEQPKRLEKFRETGKALVGDVHFGEALAVASAVTPVPGGIGPLTVALLLENTLLAARRLTGMAP